MCFVTCVKTQFVRDSVHPLSSLSASPPSLILSAILLCLSLSLCLSLPIPLSLSLSRGFPSSAHIDVCSIPVDSLASWEEGHQVWQTGNNTGDQRVRTHNTHTHTWDQDGSEQVSRPTVSCRRRDEDGGWGGYVKVNRTGNVKGRRAIPLLTCRRQSWIITRNRVITPRKETVRHQRKNILSAFEWKI